MLLKNLLLSKCQGGKDATWKQNYFLSFDMEKYNVETTTFR